MSKPKPRRRGRPTKEQQLARLKEDLSLSLSLPSYIMDSPLYESLDEEAQHRLLLWSDYIRQYTGDQLSEAEYYSMSTIMWQVEELDSLQGKGEFFDSKLAEECRRSKQAVMDKMESYRSSARKKTTNSLEEIRKVFAVVEKEDGSSLEINVTERPSKIQEAKYEEVVDLDDSPI